MITIQPVLVTGSAKCDVMVNLKIIFLVL